MRRALLLGVLLVALISLDEARQLGLLPATRQEDAYSLQFPNVYGGGSGNTIPFWRVPSPFFSRSGVYGGPRFGLGPLALGLGLSAPAGAIGAPGAVPVGRRGQAAAPETPAERAARLERMGQSGALPQAGPNLISLEEAVRRGLLPASALPPQRVLVGRGSTPAALAAARPAGPVSVPAQPPAPTVSDAAQVQAALQAAGGVAKFGGQVAEAVAPAATPTVFAPIPVPGAPGLGIDPRTGAAVDLSTGQPWDMSKPIPGSTPSLSVDPTTGLPTFAPIPVPSAPGLGIDPGTGTAVDLSTGQPWDMSQPIPGVTPGLNIDPTTGLPLSGDFGDGTDITAPAGSSWFTSLARSAAPALNLAGPALSTGAGAYQLSQGNPAGAVPLGLGSFQIAEALRTGKAPTVATGPFGLAGAGLQLGGIAAGLAGAPPEVGLGLSTAGSLATAVPYFLPGTAAYGSLLAALGPGGAGITGAASGLGAGAGALGGGAVTGAATGTAAAGGAGAAGATGGVLAGAGAAMAAVAPVLAMYAIGTTLGGIREADIEKGYQMKAKQAASDFSGNSDVLATGQNISRFRAGDTSVLPSLQSSLAAAIRTGQALMQPKGGSSAAMDKYIRGIYGAVIGTPAFGPTVIEAAKSLGPAAGQGPWDQDYATQVTYAYNKLNEFGIGSPAFYGPPPGYNAKLGGGGGLADVVAAPPPPPVLGGTTGGTGNYGMTPPQAAVAAARAFAGSGTTGGTGNYGMTPEEAGAAAAQAFAGSGHP